MDDYTIMRLAYAITNTGEDNKDEYFSALYAINVMIGELLIPSVQISNYPYDSNTNIIGLTEKGKALYQSVKDDTIWNEVQRRNVTLGGISFESLADCCEYIKHN